VKRAIDSASSTGTHGVARKVARTGVALALADIDGDADALVAVVLDGFDLAAAHRDRLSEAFGYIDFGRRRTALRGRDQQVLRDVAHVCIGIAETLSGHEGAYLAVKFGEWHRALGGVRACRAKAAIIAACQASPRPMRPKSISTEDPDDEPQYDGPSKSQRKRDLMRCRTSAQLVELSAAQLKRIDMPENLRIAIEESQKITRSREGLRRQMQFIGKVMRGIDTRRWSRRWRPCAACRRAVAAREDARTHARAAARRRAGAGRHRRPMAGRRSDQHLRTLRRNALRETELNKPPRAFPRNLPRPAPARQRDRSAGNRRGRKRMSE
jgi:ribosome-associated protein